MSILTKIEMHFDKKSILAAAGGIALASGLVIVIILLSAPVTSSLSTELQKKIPFLIFGVTMLVAAPVLSMRLNRLTETRKILGWIFIGMGAEFLIFPAGVLFLVLTSPSEEAFFISAALFTVSIIFGISSGLISFFIGIMLIKRRDHGRR